jgi:hypothetical protein
MEGILRTPAMGGRIRERVDHLEEFQNGSRPAMSQDQRQCVRMPGANVNEMNVEPVDLGQELRQGIQPCLDPPPTVLRSPIAGQFFDGRQLDALRLIPDGLPVGPSRRNDPPTEIGEI